MFLKSFRNILQRKTYQNGFSFSENYERRKAEVYKAKTQECFKVQPQSLISQNVMIDSLVPNFFTNQLLVQKYPFIKPADKRVNYFLNSYARISLPLASKPKLREKLNKLFDHEVRIGRIFELMDSIAGIVSYSHCFGGYKPGSESNPMVCVTGSVESLYLFDTIEVGKDLIMEGYLNHVGRTSMEIQINVVQQGKLKANSLFTMIARKASNQYQGYEIPSLSFDHLSKEDTDKSLLRNENAKLNVIQRREEMNNSYDKKPPNPGQIKEIHDMFLKRKGLGLNDLSGMCPISSTKIEICEVMHTQQRNFHGKIFGGFLIKEMIELGWVSACRYAQNFVVIEDLTNIYFKKPVDIGCRLTLKANVTYVEQQRVVITVEAYTSNLTQKAQNLACYLHLVARSNKSMKNVFPESYQESLQYLSSKKAFIELFY